VVSATSIDAVASPAGIAELPSVPTYPRFPEAVALAIVLAIALLLLGAYFSNLMGSVDEIGLFNPTYMDLHFGKATYPIYGYFDTMVVHPPMQYKIIAAIMRRGLSYYYAEATPTVLLSLAAIVLIAISSFPAPVKIGLLFGIVGPIAIFATEDFELFGMRPEGHLNAAWLAGLIALESGRIMNWDWKRLSLGAFLMTYASGLHYYAAPALLGIVVYLIWAVVQLGWRRAAKPVAAVITGGLLFGIPYLLLFLIPDWQQVTEMLRSVPREATPEIFRHHIEQYHAWDSYHAGGLGLGLWFRLGIPVVAISTPILLALRTTRAFALAALPLQVFVLFFAGHKHAYYYVHEISLYCAALVAGGAMLSDRLATKFDGRNIVRRVALAAIALIAGVVLLAATWHGGRSEISMEPRQQEAEVARAAGKEMLGRNARIGSRLGPWFASGAAHWANISMDLLWRTLPGDFDVARYVSKLDAVAETSHMSNSTQNGRNATLSSWYADGTLHLAGFFFAESNTELNYILLRGSHSGPLHGFGLKNGRMVRFDENASGDTEFSAMTCPAQLRGDYHDRVPYSSLLYLPRAHPNDEDQVVISALVPPDGPRTYADSHPGCKVVLHVNGFLTPVDRRAIVEKMRKEDQPMRFYKQVSDMPPTAAR